MSLRLFSPDARALPRPMAFAAVVTLGLLTSCIHKKYDTPITKNTQQPDKVLFDQSIKDIEHGRYEVARISLQTLMNTYESSEFMAKSKLAVADSWYREGGANGLAQAEAEYKDFILFYPQMEESAQAQNRVCQIHYQQMERGDRDWSQALRAEDECRSLLNSYPNSKFAPATAQLVRDIQENLAEHEFVVGNFYWRRDMNPAAANRLEALVSQYPLYSKAGESLYEAGDSYSKMGPRFRKQAGQMFARVVSEYPISTRAKEASKRLEDMELPVPKADQAALDREKYNQANYKRPGMMARSTGWLKGTPDVSHSAKIGPPTMTDPKATIPASVPVANNADAGTGSGTGSGSMEVSATAANSGALDKSPDARSTPAGTTAGTTGTTTAQAESTPAANQPLPTNRDRDLKRLREEQAKKQAKLDRKKKKTQDQNQATADQMKQGQVQVNQSPASQGAQTPPGAQNPTTPNPAQQPPTGQTPQPQR